MNKKTKPELTRDEIDRLFIVNPETGIILNRIDRTYNSKANTEAGCIGVGCKLMNVNGYLYLTHRLLWTYFYNEQPPKHIDHIDKNPLNNSIYNLRAATKSQNKYNTRKQKNNKSGYKGVCWAKANNKWKAQTKYDNKQIHLGYFDTPEEASAVYEQKAKELHGEFYYKNNI